MLDRTSPESDHDYRAWDQRGDAPTGTFEGSDHSLGAALYPSARPARAAAGRRLTSAHWARRWLVDGVSAARCEPFPQGPLVALRSNEDASEVPDADALHRSRSDHRSRPG